jgi:site-specific DNA-methyltransferase (adenine-specific)
MTGLPRNTVIVGDALDQLGRLPADSVDCIVTSPPYFAARDYGHRDQLGHESDVDGWVRDLRAVFTAAARVLKPTGALWLNLGDSYARHPAEGARTKSLLLGPERLALALAADGWTLRNKVIWAKTNPMPSSVRDRLTCTYEVVYFFTRSQHYFFDLDSIREPLRTRARPTTSDPSRAYPPAGTGAPIRGSSLANDNRGLSRLKAAGVAGNVRGKNPGDVWSLATASYRGLHFATFPTGLVDRPLLSTCPARACASCGRPQHDRPCSCGSRQTVPGVVLDPFFGAGTVALAAERLGRDWLGIELNPAFADLAEQRLTGARARRAEAPVRRGGR